MSRKTERELAGSNPFKNSIRGNVKSNAQVDNFNKSQEVFKMLKNTLGTASAPTMSASFRIPRKQSPPKATSNLRDSKRDSYNKQHTERNNFRQNDKGKNDQTLSSRRKTNIVSSDDRIRKQPRSLYGSESSRKRSHDYSLSYKDIESTKPKCSAYNNLENTTCSSNEKRISEIDQRFPSRSNNPFSKIFPQEEHKSPFTEKRSDNAFSNVFIRRSRESSPDQRFSAKKDEEKEITHNNSGEPHDQSMEILENRSLQVGKLAEINSSHSQEGEDISNVIERKRMRYARANLGKKLRKGELCGKPWLFTIKERLTETSGVTQENAGALLEKILNFLEETIMQEHQDCDMPYPQYFGYTYKNSIFTVLSANFSSRDYLWKKIEQISNNNNRKLLQCNIVTHDERFFDVKVPKSISHFSEFRALCEKGNSDVDTTSWRLVEYNDDRDDKLRLYTVGMEAECYAKIRKDLKSVVRCGDEDLHFLSSVKNIPVDYRKRKMYLQEEKEKYEN